jgi:hypothetical protein
MQADNGVSLPLKARNWSAPGRPFDSTFGSGTIMRPRTLPSGPLATILVTRGRLLAIWCDSSTGCVDT